MRCYDEKTWQEREQIVNERLERNGCIFLNEVYDILFGIGEEKREPDITISIDGRFIDMMNLYDDRKIKPDFCIDNPLTNLK